MTNFNLILIWRDDGIIEYILRDINLNNPTTLSALNRLNSDFYIHHVDLSETDNIIVLITI
jgi:hypothetical protein